MADKVIVRANRASRESQIDEGIASEALTPSALIDFGGSNDLQTHQTQDGNAAPWFAMEPLDPGKDIEDDNQSGDSTRYFKASAGDKVHALLFAGENVSKGAKLSSNGDGTLHEYTPSGSDESDAVVAEAAEAVDNSGSSSSTRIKVEVM